MVAEKVKSRRNDMVYGYCRISRKQQRIERQIRNISAAYPDAPIIQETYTGAKSLIAQHGQNYTTE